MKYIKIQSIKNRYIVNVSEPKKNRITIKCVSVCEMSERKDEAVICVCISSNMVR